jgi:hypothetical protein
MSMSDDYEKLGKKRGRKPKGGKIIASDVSIVAPVGHRPNIILHLKCHLKDLQVQSNDMQSNSVQFYSESNVGFEILKKEEPVATSEDDDEYVEKDFMKEISRKLKQLESNLHSNHIGNRRSCCFWDSCEFDNPPIHIPKYYLNGTYHVYGCFCSPECAAAYLMRENIDSSIKFERYHLLNYIYSKIYGFTKNIKPAPDPHYMLAKYYGNLSIPEYRSLFQKERLFLIVDKPMTRVLPELHEDNDSFILNNKVIASNSCYGKNKKTNKNDILNEKFGLS